MNIFFKIVSSTLFVLLLTANISNAKTFLNQQHSGYGIIADKDRFVNLRKEPNLNSKVIRTLNNGTLVFCHIEGGSVNKFCFIQTKGFEGYVHSSRIRVLESTSDYQQSKRNIVLKNEDFIILVKLSESKKYESIKILRKNEKQTIPNTLLDDLEGIQLESHQVYVDPKSSVLYLTAGSIESGMSYNLVWSIKSCKKVTRWKYIAY